MGIRNSEWTGVPRGGAGYSIHPVLLIIKGSVEHHSINQWDVRQARLMGRLGDGTAKIIRH